jgi:glutamate synthase (ferredoxin)
MENQTASMDMVIELLLMTDARYRSYDDGCLKHGKHQTMSDDIKSIHEYKRFMEPWDGPASIPFTDGNDRCTLTEMVCVPLCYPLPKMGL